VCGISGFASTAPIPPDGVQSAAMVAALARRGPDSTGSAAWSHARLGHNRLAVFDLSERGSQPMLSDSGQIGVVFNGAIYNFRELRADLQRQGVTFRSESDTEVLVHGYQAWGIRGLVSRLRGMFAFAVWDEGSRSLHLVRDRLGVKPLLYGITRDSVAFASTAGALRAAGYAGDVDPQALADFLEWGVVPDQLSIYRGIAKLPPATIATWAAGQLQLHPYWSPPTPDGRAPQRFEEAVEEAEELLLAATRRRLQADVPIGALLSGGIDSALVCWALKEAGSSISTYTFSAPGEPEDETHAAMETAGELGVPLEVLTADSGRDDLEDLFDAYSEPFACGSALGMLKLSAAAREVVTVLLTGDGGDDVFLGYPQHRYLLTAQQLGEHLPRAVAAAAARTGVRAPASGFARRARNFAAYASSGLGDFLRVRASHRFFREREALGPLMHDMLPASQQVPSVPGSGKTVLDDYLAYTLKHQFVAEYLTKVDGATMFHALEARSPFLDQELWEFAAALPYRIRMHGGAKKAILREIARRRISPRVAMGAKRGFEVPVGRWLMTRWREQAMDLLTSRSMREQEWLRTAPLIDLLRSGDRPPLELWYAVVFAGWLDRQYSRTGTDAPAALQLGA
jgi:asparagine synthase (glutamine-hydrolysing)